MIFQIDPGMSENGPTGALLWEQEFFQILKFLNERD